MILRDRVGDRTKRSAKVCLGDHALNADNFRTVRSTDNRSTRRLPFKESGVAIYGKAALRIGFTFRAKTDSEFNAQEGKIRSG